MDHGELRAAQRKDPAPLLRHARRQQRRHWAWPSRRWRELARCSAASILARMRGLKESRLQESNGQSSGVFALQKRPIFDPPLIDDQRHSTIKTAETKEFHAPRGVPQMLEKGGLVCPTEPAPKTLRSPRHGRGFPTAKTCSWMGLMAARCPTRDRGFLLGSGGSGLVQWARR